MRSNRSSVGDDVEDDQPLDSFRVVERHPVCDARAAVVADDRESPELERVHQLHEIEGHLSLAEPLPLRTTGGSRGRPVAAEIGYHDMVAL
jgi:hypothetical protein